MRRWTGSQSEGWREIRTRKARKTLDRDDVPPEDTEALIAPLLVVASVLLRGVVRAGLDIGLFSTPSSFTTARVRGRPRRAPGSIEEQTR